MQIGNLVIGSNAKFGGLNAQAAEFIKQAGITNHTIINAENAFFIDRQKIGNYENAIASYHLVTDKVTNTDRLAQFKFNAYSPYDNNANKRLIYSGTVTANTTGLQGSANGFANTYINPFFDLLSTDITIIMIIRNSTGAGVDLGVVDGGAAGISITVKHADNSTYLAVNGNQSNVGNINPNVNAIYSIKRSGNTLTVRRNDVIVYTNSSYSTNVKVNNYIYLLCRNFNNAGQFYSAKEYSFFEFINGALTSQQESDFYAALVKRELALGR